MVKIPILDTMAPEVHLEKKYGTSCDWWAVGITYCDMRSDKAVFDGADSKEYSDSTAKVSVLQFFPHFNTFSRSAHDFQKF